MHRVLFQIGPIPIYSFGVLILTAFIAATLFARSRATRYGWSREQIWDVAFVTLLAGILGSRLVFILQELGYYSKHPEEVLTLQFQGLTSFGAIVFGFLTVWMMARRFRKTLWSILDILGPAFLVGNAIGRIGCLLNGCCFGGACDLPWAVPVEGMPGLYHPAQIYDSLMNLGALGIVLWLERRGLSPGQCFCLSMAGYGSSRFIYEFWRAGVSSTYLDGLPITDAHAAAGAVVIVGVVAFVRLRRQAQAPGDGRP